MEKALLDVLKYFTLCDDNIDQSDILDKNINNYFFIAII